MRHRKAGRALGRPTAARYALKRDIVNALFTHERIVTTQAKAKEFRPFAEHCITLAKRAAARPELKLHHYRRLIQLLHNEDAAYKLMHDIGPRFLDREKMDPKKVGGYTRILLLGGHRRMSKRDADPGRFNMFRLGDNGVKALFELVERKEEEEAPEVKGKKEKTAAK
ncbi:MAG: 50S ribosomal protein L17 [Planctomycetes bacterium]|nr:50S ribosomal protein L17 [Planctomycetota bacterium]